MKKIITLITILIISLTGSTINSQATAKVIDKKEVSAITVKAKNKAQKKKNKKKKAKKITTVNGIKVSITSSVSSKDRKKVISWIKKMPKSLTKYIKSVNVVDDMKKYTLTGKDASGVTRGGHNIYLKASGISGRLGSLYHEAGHCLDFDGGYSNTSAWEKIRSAEWSNEGYYSSSSESFAEAISRYYVDGLEKKQTKKAIKKLIKTGSLGKESKKKIKLYAKYKAIWIYSGPSDFYGKQIGTVQIGGSIQAIGLTEDKTWYKVKFNGKTGYVKADMVSLTP